jgi:hypothetical protein
MHANLITVYYAEPRQRRRAELELCLEINAGTFERVLVLSEGEGPAAIGGSSIECRRMDRRQKYADALALAREIAADDDVTVIANCDIFVPPASLLLAKSALEPGQAWCLSRYELASGVALFDVEYSQDAWVFRGKPRSPLLAGAAAADYFFGVPGCDNRFAWELQESGYAVSNPSRSVRTYHVHGSRQRTVTNHARHRVPPPYLFIRPHELGQVPVLSSTIVGNQ